MKTRLSLLGLLCLLACGDKRSVSEPAGRRDAARTIQARWVTGYYAAYQQSVLPVGEIDWSGLTHVVFTRLKTAGAGRLAHDFDVDPVEGPKLARELAVQAHQHGKKALLMVGGENAGAGFVDATRPEHLATFVTSLLEAVRDYGYDGLDLDWEDQIDYERFVALVHALRTARDAPAGLLLTVPGWAINRNFQSVEPRVAELARALDQYNLMSYYPATAATGAGWMSWHNSPLSGAKLTTPVAIDDSLARYVAAGVPREKLGMGVSFYAICYTGDITAPNQLTLGSVSIEGGDNALPLSALFGPGGSYDARHLRWDEDAKASYLSLPAPDARGCRYLSFDDPRSLAEKGAFARRHGYGGVIVWTLNQGVVADGGAMPKNALTQALKRAFLDP